MLTEAQIADLKAKHGDKIEAVIDDATDEVVAVLRPPTSPEWDRFTSMILDDDQRAQAMKILARACMVWPDASVFKDRPALVATVGSQLKEMGGAVKSVSRKKL